MKKLTSLLLSLVLMISVLACGASAKTSTKVRIAGLKGPTTMGLVNLLSMEKDGTASLDYDLQLYGAADEIVPLLMKGELDMAAIPANLAATLYQKTNGGIQAVAVNTLGVLYVVEQGDTVQSMADLKGRTILSTGKGTTPEYVLRYLLNANGIDPDKDVTIQFVGEGSELLTVWQSDPDAVILAPQPVATSILMQNENAAKLFDMTEEWSKISGNQLMMGCVIVRNAFLQENPGAVELFLKEYAASIEKAQTDVEGTAALCEQYGLIPKAALAQKAIPSCGLTFVTGAEMKTDLSAYLQVMYDADPKSVGGALPGDDFYYGA